MGEGTGLRSGSLASKPTVRVRADHLHTSFSRTGPEAVPAAAPGPNLGAG